MKKLVLTNSYDERKKQEETFKKQIKDIVATLKKRFSRYVKIEIDYKFKSNSLDQNMFWADVIVLDQQHKRAIHLQFRCDATVFISHFILREHFKNAAAILESRLLFNTNSIMNVAIRSKRPISIEEFPAQLKGCTKFLRNRRVEAVVK